MMKMLEDERACAFPIVDLGTCLCNWCGASGMLFQGFGIPYCLTSWYSTGMRWIGMLITLIQ